MSNVVPLRYVARAGLLPELTRQTYDSLYKALREVILNSVDAGATNVIVDLSAVETDGVLEIRDNGSGMSLDELQQSFMSLGGSAKFESTDRFGRIGIGSLALMHYAQTVEIETTQVGSPHVTKAVLSHPWALDQTQRAQALGDFRAGDAWQEEQRDLTDSHYTRLRLHGVDSVLVGECSDVGAYYKLVDRLRRILPLAWRDETRLATELESASPDVADILRAHTTDFCAHVVLQSRWAEEDLVKRTYGDSISHEEEWNGTPHPILRHIAVEDERGQRQITVAGYLLSQLRPTVDWSGLTARVQNVAVEERTFFDLESDPGFRKYIAGEVWLLGGVDRARLINIDRASFNRESADYRAVARELQAELVRFKAEYVQAPQRAKVAVKRRLDQQIALLDGISGLASSFSSLVNSPKAAGIRSSNNGVYRNVRSRALLEDLQALGATVAVAGGEEVKAHYRLRVASDGQRVLAEVADRLLNPYVTIAAKPYRLVLVEAKSSDPPLLIKNRPREIAFNLSHTTFAGELRVPAAEAVAALEFGYLLSDGGGEEMLYDSILALLSGR